MIRRFLTIYLLFFLPVFSFSQVISYSEPLKDSKDAHFEIIGKVGGNILIFKNVKADYSISIYDNEMKLKEIVPLDFLPEKTFKVNFIAYPNFVYLFYQYQIKKTVYCATMQLDADAKAITQPVGIDTAEIGNHTNTILVCNSEDKQKIMLVNAIKQNGELAIATTLLDNNLHLIKKASQSFSYDETKDLFDNFLIDNDGGLLFTRSEKDGGKNFFSQVNFITKPAMADTFSTNNIDLKGRYVAAIYTKIDNINKHYIFNTFFYTEKKGDVQGIYANVWDKQNNTFLSSVFISFGDAARIAAKKEGHAKDAFNDYIIKNVIVKKDGGYILMAEDYAALESNNNNGYNPYYNPFSPYGFANTQTITYYYKNILVTSIDKSGVPEWSNIIEKDQSSDNDDNALSFTTFITGGQIHLFFNELDKQTQQLSDNTINVSGEINKNAGIKPDKDYEFLPRFGKQVGAKQFIIPCSFRNAICFAKIDY